MTLLFRQSLVHEKAFFGCFRNQSLQKKLDVVSAPFASKYRSLAGLQFDMNEEKAANLPPAFVKFLDENDINPDIYQLSYTLPRYVRLKPGLSDEETIAIARELGAELVSLSWLPSFFSLPADINIAGSNAYKTGQIFGMDAASGAAVEALDPQPGEHILDLCTAPGAKLCMIADLLGSVGTITAVDIAKSRLSASCTMLRKYDLADRCRLYLADGSTFSIGPPTPVDIEGISIKTKGEHQDAKNAGCDTSGSSGEACRLPPGLLEVIDIPANHPSQKPFHINADVLAGTQKPADKASTLSTSNVASIPGINPKKKKTRKEKQRARRAELFGHTPEESATSQVELFMVGREGYKWFGPSATVLSSGVGGYDKVLVDSECTHDGSLKHIIKYDDWGWNTFEKRFFNPLRIAALTELQRQLLSNGYQLLKPGGILIYSTCSFTKAQNEDVISWFMQRHDTAELVPIEKAKQWPCSPGSLPNTLRFDPLTSKTSGLFIARIKKLEQ